MVRFRVWARVPTSVCGVRVRGSVHAGPEFWSGVQVRGSVQGSGTEFGLESRVQVRGSVQDSGPEFSLEFRFGVRFRVRGGAPSSVLSSGSEFGSGFCGVRNAFLGKWWGLRISACVL